MSNLGWRSIVACTASSLLAIAGCSSESLRSGTDGALPDATESDPAACGCQVTDYVLTMSLACYCQRYDCAQPEPSCAIYSLGRGCGLTEYSEDTISGPEDWVYDQSGHLVGVQLSSDDSGWVCPTDPSMFASAVRAGQFPDSCQSFVACRCNGDGGTSCASPDAAVPLF